MAETLSPNLRTIGRYTLLREIRRDRHSVSYTAMDPVLNRELVLKAVQLSAAGTPLPEDTLARIEQAFVRQAQAAGRLHHPHIVTVFDAGRSRDIGYLVLERVSGRALHDLIARGLRPAFVQCASIVARVADALEYAHQQGIAHGHLGPQLVYLQADGSPKVSGFGGWIDAGAGDEVLARTEDWLPYFQNEATAAARQADIRAATGLLYMMLTGRAPGTDPDTSLRIARSDTPPDLAELVTATLTGRDGGARTAADLRDRLTSFVWNERKEGIAPGTIGIPLSAPPPTVVRAMGVANLRFANEDGPASVIGTPAPALPSAAAAPAVPRIGFGDWFAGSSPRQRQTVMVLGGLLFASLIIGLILGNLRKPLTASPVTVAAPASPAIAAPAALTGVLRLEVVPWGEVVVDNKLVGVAPPLHELSLSAGKHTIEIRQPDKPAWVGQVNIDPAQPAVVSHRFD